MISAQFKTNMQVLYIHGMGRSPLSGLAMLWALKKVGFKPVVFAYCVSFESFAAITQRLAQKIAALAAQGDYILIGHSLGGVLLRAALGALAASATSANMRQAQQIFLLGSPIRSARLARRLKHNNFYRLITGDCGQLLASDARMAEIPAISVPTTAIIGTQNFLFTRAYFGDEVNDGVVSLSEVTADWLSAVIEVPVLHSWLPARRAVSALMIKHLQAR